MGSLKGSVYKRGNYWWIAYIDSSGKRHHESSESTKKTVAQEKLNSRLELVRKDQPIVPTKVRFKELLEDVATDYRLNGQEFKDSIRTPLLDFFGGRIANLITTADIKEFILQQQTSGGKKNQGLSDATINRSLAALKRAYHLGMEHTPQKVTSCPYIPMFEENNVKEGFLEPIVFDALKVWFLEHAPDLVGFITFAYYTGMRYQEIAGLTWDPVDLEEGIIRLAATDTKNKKARHLAIESGLLPHLQDAWEKRIEGCPFVFHKNGKKIIDIRGIWNRACRETGLGYGYRLSIDYVKNCEKKGLTEGPTIHDFRRSAVNQRRHPGLRGSPQESRRFVHDPHVRRRGPFMNDTGQRYHKEAAELAWKRTVAFLKDKLKG